ncbi:MAG: hypothetical protein PHV32_16660, partial [Eubacteriales bacterium]|nr:hypothetical protein [Eubacteriales bacterium]
MNMKSSFAALILAILIASGFIITSCAAPAEDNASTAVTETAEAITEEESTELQPNLPDNLDFEGQDFMFLVSSANDTNGVDWVTYDIWVESENGDAINDAVFMRNLYLKDKYNVNIVQTDSGSSPTLAMTQKSVKAGSDDYDAVITNIAAGGTLAQSGMIYNLYDVGYIDLTMPWWDQRAVEDLSIGGKVYYATGDVTSINNDATWVLMFSKKLAADNNIPNLYDAVRSGNWTFDMMLENMRTVARDVNGDGKMGYDEDIYGFATHASSGPGLMYASGEKITKKDADGYPTLAVNVERMAGVIELAGQILSDRNITFTLTHHSKTTDELRNLFEGGRALFFGEVMQCIIRMRASENDFGLISWPKYDENQDEYYNHVHSTAGKIVCIPLTQPDLEFAGAVIEAFAAKSRYTLTVAYYDVALTYKYMRDEESVEMLDIV